MPLTPPTPTSHPSLRDLLLASDFGRAHPDKVDLLLSVAAYGLNNNATSTARHSDDCPLPERAA